MIADGKYAWICIHVDLGEEAAQNFREGNVLDTAVHTLDKIAKTVEVYTPSRAVQLYLKVRLKLTLYVWMIITMEENDVDNISSY